MMLTFQCLQKTLQHCRNLYFTYFFYVIQVCFLFQRNESNLNSTNHFHALKKLFLLTMLQIFFNARQPHPSLIGIIKRITCFSCFELCFEKQYAGFIFSFLAYKTLRAIIRLFFSIFFQLSFSDRQFIHYQLHLWKIDLIFTILPGLFSIYL